MLEPWDDTTVCLVFVYYINSDNLVLWVVVSAILPLFGCITSVTQSIYCTVVYQGC